jgi:hypothetical protein
MMQSVQLIIERLKTHPEDFFGEVSDRQGLGLPRPKFYDITDKIDNLLSHPQEGHVHRLWYLTDTERLALIEAYKEARRARFEAKVFHTLLTKQEPEETSTVTYKTVNRYHPHTGKPLMQGSNVIAPQNVFKEEGGPVNV